MAFFFDGASRGAMMGTTGQMLSWYAMLSVVLGVGVVVLLTTTTSGRTLWEYGTLRLRMYCLSADARAPAKPRRTMRAPPALVPPPGMTTRATTRD